MHDSHWQTDRQAARLITSNQINIFINSSKEKKRKEKEIPLLKEWKVRNKLTTYTIPAHNLTHKNYKELKMFYREMK